MPRTDQLSVLLFMIPVTCVLTGITLPLLRRFILDEPNVRSSHFVVIPRGGGVALVLGLVSVTLVYSGADRTTGIVCIGIAAMTLIGFMDDLRSRSPMFRLSLMSLTCVAISIVIVRDSGSTWVNVPLVALFLVGFTNSFNFMDGIDGISAVSGSLAAGWLSFLAAQENLEQLVLVGLGISGACLGFLPWNFPRARVFLGDSGSYGVGFGVALLAAFIWLSGAPVLLCVSALTIYLADTSTAFLRRIARGEGWATAHRQHVYQRLVDQGYSHLCVVVVVTTFTCLAVGTTWAAGRGEVWWAVAPLVVIAIAYLRMPTWLSAANLDNR